MNLNAPDFAPSSRNSNLNFVCLFQISTRCNTMAENQSDHGVRSSNTALLQKLASAVNGHAATATFACGGSVPLSDLSTGNFGSGAQNLFPSVTLRWDSKDAYMRQSKLTFPLPHHDDVSRSMLSRLLHHCEPATFGVGGQDVLDERYRKAAKLDTSQFSTNFHPHDCGILDSIQQLLLPSTIGGGQGVGIGPQGVRAELYKLNVCKSNIAIAKLQVGLRERYRSIRHPLVNFCLMWIPHVELCNLALSSYACLVNMKVRDSRFPAPAANTLIYYYKADRFNPGGELRVKHRGETVDFPWGHTSQQSVQWAAFYGDCEHEVLEVTKGHRITLTYNLYYSSIGKLAQSVSSPQHLPLFDIAREMLLQQNFMRKGELALTYCFIDLIMLTVIFKVVFSASSATINTRTLKIAVGNPSPAPSKALTSPCSPYSTPSALKLAFIPSWRTDPRISADCLPGT